MSVYYEDQRVTLHQGDVLAVLPLLPDASVDAVVTDPPYGLGFMGKAWDDLPPGLPFAQECLRVLKPGGHLLAFGGSRTWHRLAVAVEDAGFEIRDSIAWLYGSGFPKSLDVSKAIDKRRDWSLVKRLSDEIRRARAESGMSLAQVGEAMLAATGDAYGKWYHRGGHMFFETGRSLPSRPEWEHLRRALPIAIEFEEVYAEAEREVVGERETSFLARSRSDGSRISGDMLMPDERGMATVRLTVPTTDAARQWQSWGTALKPAFEPIVVGRKPLAGTVAANVLEHGTGALNIDACRVGENGGARRSVADTEAHGRPNAVLGKGLDLANAVLGKGLDLANAAPRVDGLGRWPTNVVLDDATAAELDEHSGERRSAGEYTKGARGVGAKEGAASIPIDGLTSSTYSDSGGASRFFPTFRYEAKADSAERPRVDGVSHPTVKPLALMRWLVRLVTPPGGTVLEPFAGSGTTVEACLIEGFRCIAIEREADYLPLIEARIARRTNAARALELAGEDMGLFGFLDDEDGAA